MYIVTEVDGDTTHVRGVFSDRTKYDRNIDRILETAKLGTTVCAYTGQLNGVLTRPRCVERFKIKIVPEVRKAVKL